MTSLDGIIPGDFVVAEVGPYNLTRPVFFFLLREGGVGSFSLKYAYNKISYLQIPDASMGLVYLYIYPQNYPKCR